MRCPHCNLMMMEYIPFGLGKSGEWDCTNDWCTPTQVEIEAATATCDGEIQVFNNVGKGWYHCYDCGKVYDERAAEELEYQCTALLMPPKLEE